MQAMAAEGRAIPLHLGSPQQFETMRTGLRRLSFDEAAICQRTGASSIFSFQRKLEGRTGGRELNDALDVLIHLFMDGETLPAGQVRALVPPDLVDTAEALGVLAAVPQRPDLCYATVALYPVAGIYVASDRVVLIDGVDTAKLRDAVYPAITRNTQWFLSALPQTPCQDLLDLCSGTGVAALAGAARYAGNAWSCDLVERSVRFAEFNRLLNGIENAVCAGGDLYTPVGDRTFDRIVAHPPYVPSEERQVLYRDGGEDGEQVLRGVVEGLPRHLRPGGRCYCVSMATDREGETVEQRIRRWLGEHERDFDVMLVAFATEMKPDSLVQVVEKRKSRWLQLPSHNELWERLKVTGMFFGAIVLERLLAPRPPATARVRRSERAGSEAIEWFAHWSIAAAAAGFDDRLLGWRPRISSRLELRVTHKVENGALLPARFELECEDPFAIRALCSNWMAVVVGSCDGRRTTLEIYDDLQRQEVIHPAMTAGQFARQIRELIACGLLELEEFPLPAVAVPS